MWEDLVLAAGLGATAVLSVIGGLVLLTLLQRPAQNARASSIFREGPDATVFLFDGEDLVDATPSAYRFLSGSGFPDKPWIGLLERLSSRFDRLEERLSEVAVVGSAALTGTPREGAQPVALRAEMRGGLLKIALVNPGRETASHHGDVLTVHALDCELQDLRDASNAMPFPVWRAMGNGDILWANAAYMDRLSRVPRLAEQAEWPLRALFDLSHAKGDQKAKPLRRCDPDGVHWFDISVQPVGDGVICYAMPADAIVHAEGTLQDFKQTLTNTFAELTTGLAVFDHNRKLQLFNPALAKLIEIPVELLLKRPALFSILDAMRDRNMLPEPKDYKSWRHQMVDLEAAAVRGEYKEVWHLPNGKALRVVGRPYPNGALALMVDDITDQITRDRLFRAELDVALSVIDQMEDAIVVVSSSGQITLVNDRYQALWGHDPLKVAGKMGAMGLLEEWRKVTVPSLVWTEVEAALTTGSASAESQTIAMLDGRQLSCRVAGLADGATCFTFRQMYQTIAVPSAPVTPGQDIPLSA
jgi:PAS domain-containing protein